MSKFSSFALWCNFISFYISLNFTALCRHIKMWLLYWTTIKFNLNLCDSLKCVVQGKRSIIFYCYRQQVANFCVSVDCRGMKRLLIYVQSITNWCALLGVQCLSRGWGFKAIRSAILCVRLFTILFFHLYCAVPERKISYKDEESVSQIIDTDTWWWEYDDLKNLKLPEVAPKYMKHNKNFFLSHTWVF